MVYYSRYPGPHLNFWSILHNSVYALMWKERLTYVRLSEPNYSHHGLSDTTNPGPPNTSRQLLQCHTDPHNTNNYDALMDSPLLSPRWLTCDPRHHSHHWGSCGSHLCPGLSDQHWMCSCLCQSPEDHRWKNTQIRISHCTKKHYPSC